MSVSNLWLIFFLNLVKNQNSKIQAIQKTLNQKNTKDSYLQLHSKTKINMKEKILKVVNIHTHTHRSNDMNNE